MTDEFHIRIINYVANAAKDVALDVSYVILITVMQTHWVVIDACSEHGGHVDKAFLPRRYEHRAT